MEPTLLLELRRYRLRPGARDTLVELFAREPVEPPGAVVRSSVPNLFPALPVHDGRVAVILGEGPVRLRPRHDATYS
jgi:hypothetical protein